jgi:hypothetical protein
MISSWTCDVWILFGLLQGDEDLSPGWLIASHGQDLRGFMVTLTVLAPDSCARERPVLGGCVFVGGAGHAGGISFSRTGEGEIHVRSQLSSRVM